MPDITFDLIITSADAGYVVQAAAPMAVGELPAQSFALSFDLARLPQKRRDAAEWVAQAREFGPALRGGAYYLQNRLLGR